MNRREAFRATFLGDRGLGPTRANEITLAYLRRYCGVADRNGPFTIVAKALAGGQVDPYMMAVMAGRREVFMEIMKYLHMEEREVLRLKEQDE